MLTARHSPLLSEIGYHLYTVFLFTKNDILTAIIPVVGMMPLSLRRRSLQDLSDTVCHCLCTSV